MQFLAEVNKFLNTKGFNWEYCVVSHISQYASRYGSMAKSYEALNRHLHNAPKNLEVIIADSAPLPNGGQANFAVLYRTVSEPALPQHLQAIIAGISPADKWVFVFEPDNNLVAQNDTAVLIYKIDAGVVQKI
ncbi:MAG: hypothetical protein LBK66_09805 [Spirochaetaceae bacterium]|jgi:hypothetical protein|nr:hypothetical protein [Spirochaetaceae bacterium]